MIGVAFAAIAGVPAGGLVRSWTYTMSVPASAPAPRRTSCVHCGARVGRYLTAGGRCASCRRRIGSAPFVLEVLLAFVFGVAAWRVREPLVLLAMLWVATPGVALAVIDRAVLRLPDRLTYAAFTGCFAVLAAAALVDRTPVRLAWVALGGLGMAAFYLLVMVASRSAMGAGDMKLALAIGTALGWFGWRYVILGTFAGFLLAAVTGLALMATGRATRRTRLPHGPFMLLGAGLTVVALG